MGGLKKDYALAIHAFVAIPVVTFVGMSLLIFINPEIAARSAHYVLIFQLLANLKTAIFVTTLAAVVLLWFLTCYFLVKAKNRPIYWTALGFFGPFGLIVLVALRSGEQGAGSPYQSFVGRIWLPLRLFYEVALFVVAWMLADWVVEVKRDFIILHQAVMRGVTIPTIVAEQEASGGMWAFSEGLEMLFLMVLFYLLWPTCFNLVARLIRTGDGVP